MNELYHHGIKGQKWGVRRYQNKDGSLTPSGKKRYDEGYSKKPNIIDRHRNKLVEKYVQKGYGQQAAETAAKQRMRTEAIIGAIGAIAITAASIKISKRIGEDYFDKTIKSGKNIQNIGADAQATFKDRPFFAAINKNDKKAYGMLYPNEKHTMEVLKGNSGEIYNNTIKITKNVKRASVKKARDTFYEQMDNDPSFRKQVLSAIKNTSYGDSSVDNYEKTGVKTKKLYDRFNQALATPEFQNAGIHNKYYSALQKKGYNAILDINDTRYSGYKKISKSPTIFFGDDSWEKVSSRKLNDSEIANNASKYATSFYAKQSVKTLSKYSIGAVAIRQVAQQQVVNNYISRHPNTKLSRKEIFKKNKDGDI